MPQQPDDRLTPLSVGNALQLDMEMRNLSQPALAQLMGVSQQAVAKWIATNRVPRGRVEQLRHVLGATATVFSAIRQAERIGEYAEAEDSGIGQLLPAPLKAHVNDGAHADRRLDYLSDTLAVECKRVDDPASAMAAAREGEMRLRIVRELTRETHPTRRYALVLCVPFEMQLAAAGLMHELTQFRHDAQMLGTDVWVLRSLEEAAQLVRTLERAGP